MNEQEIARRMPVWTALAELFLDTEPRNFDYRHIADILRASAYTPEELEKIFSEEVAPVFHANLRSVAGEWQPWDAEFVKSRVLGYLNSRPTFAERCLPSGWLRARRTAGVEKHWERLRELLGQ